jgi:hypothetical protein
MSDATTTVRAGHCQPSDTGRGHDTSYDGMNYLMMACTCKQKLMQPPHSF